MALGVGTLGSHDKIRTYLEDPGMPVPSVMGMVSPSAASCHQVDEAAQGASRSAALEDEMWREISGESVDMFSTNKN